jgi:hypothetical protein
LVTRREFHGLHATGGQRFLKLRSERGIAVVNQASLLGQEPVLIIAKVARYLSHPARVRLGCDASDLNAASSFL